MGTIKEKDGEANRGTNSLFWEIVVGASPARKLFVGKPS